MKIPLIIATLFLLLTGCANEQPIPESTQGENLMTEVIVTEPEYTQAETMPEEEPMEPVCRLPELRQPRDADFVAVADYLPDMIVELRYATVNNFTGKVIYSFDQGYLRYGTVCKLRSVCRELKEQGLYLKLWDGFRPVSAQFVLWDTCPDPIYVANPNYSFSPHSRGHTVDVTLVDEDGRELIMPTEFDDFSTKANRDYSDCTLEEATNAMLLQTVMEKHGFRGYQGEWWHFVDTTAYEVEHIFDPYVIRWTYAQCEEFLSLWDTPTSTGNPAAQIPAGERMILLGETGEYSMVDYYGIRGFVLTEYTAE